MSLTSAQQSAYDNISSRLQDGFWSGVNEDDLNAVRSQLSDLSATDADAVIDAMADHGLLQKFADEANDGEFLGMGQDGFSTSERQALFSDLASKLDGDSLAKVSNAFAQAESGETDFDVVTEFAGAVASHASPAAKVDYIRALAGSTTDGGGINHYYPGGSASHEVDSEAGAIGTVLSSLRGSYADQAFRALTPDQLGAVLKTGVDQTTFFSEASVSTSFDSARYEGVMRAAASISDPDLKAQVFNAGAETLRNVRDADNFPAISSNDAALNGMTRALTSIIDSDTTGVVRELTYNTATQDGSALATYSQVMIETGQTEKLAEQMTKLQFGNNLNENAVTRLDAVTTRNGQQYRENAGALGYFVGAVYAGAKAHSGDVQKQQEVVTGFLNFALGKIPLGGGFSAGDAQLGQDFVKQAVQAAINDPGAAPAQRLERAALPQQNGELAVGDNITNAFDTTLNRVIRSAQP